MKTELVNYPMRIEKSKHQALKVISAQRDIDMRKIFLEGAELWLEKHGLSKPENVGESRKDQQFNDLVRHFFKHGDAGQIALFRMALEDHRKKNKLPA